MSTLHRNLTRIGATVTIAGSGLFLVAAFLPISRVFPEPSPAKKLEIIEADPGQWLVAQVMFALGAVLTVIGIVLFAYSFRHEPFPWLGWTSAILLAVGVVPWVWGVSARAADPASFAEGLQPPWRNLMYFLLTEVGLGVFGAALLAARGPAWLGWLVMAAMAALAAVTLVFGDIAPFFFYAVTLLVGIVFLARRTPGRIPGGMTPPDRGLGSHALE